MDYSILNKTPDVAQAVVGHYVDASGNAIAVSAASPQPVVAAVAPSGASTDGSTAIATGGTAQNLFGGTTPTNGWAVYNPDASETLWVSDTTTAAANGQGSIPVFAGSGYETPAGRKPLGAVSVYGATTGHKITASRW